MECNIVMEIFIPTQNASCAVEIRDSPIGMADYRFNHVVFWATKMLTILSEASTSFTDVDFWTLVACVVQQNRETIVHFVVMINTFYSAIFHMDMIRY